MDPNSVHWKKGKEGGCVGWTEAFIMCVCLFQCTFIYDFTLCVCLFHASVQPTQPPSLYFIIQIHWAYQVWAGKCTARSGQVEFPFLDENLWSIFLQLKSSNQGLEKLFSGYSINMQKDWKKFSFQAFSSTFIGYCP